MINQELLLQTIAELAPPQYQLSKEGPLTLAACEPEESFLRIFSAGRTPEHGIFAGGMLFNMHEHWAGWGISGERLEKWRGKYWLVVNQSIRDKDELAFIVMHELGHLDWALGARLNGLGEDEEEVYADWYAFERIKEKWGAEKALSLVRYASIDGLGKNE